MAIYAYQNAVTNFVEFLKNIREKEFIDGFVLHITMTKDNQIIVYTPESSRLSIESIQGSDLKEIEESGTIELKKFLTELPKDVKKMILYITPLITPPLSEEILAEVNARNWAYIEKLKNILLPFQHLNIRLASISRGLVRYMQQQINFIDIGWILSPLDLNYHEVDFFVLPTTLVNANIIRQELERGGKIIIQIITDADLELIFRFFGGESTHTNQDLFSKMEFITAYPNIFYTLFKQKGFLT